MMTRQQGRAASCNGLAGSAQASAAPKRYVGGVRYGLAVAVLATIPTYLIYHAVSPFPLDLAIKQIVYDTIAVVLMGIVLAWLNR
jgi:hypothetical protein